jgi:acetyl-CoA carboxylase biotin carboxyl carrier protein
MADPKASRGNGAARGGSGTDDEARAEVLRGEIAAIRRLADDLLPALMARLEASELGELEVSRDGWRVRLRKPVETEVSNPKVAADRGAIPIRAGKRDTGRQAARPDGRPDAAESPRRVVASPAVGIFQPEGGATLGKPVRAGDVVGRVEVLGIPQEVVAPFDGILGRMLVEPGEIVEFGEPLMRIDAATT